MTTTNNADLELQYMRLQKESDDLSKQVFKLRMKSNNAIKILKLNKKHLEIIRECKELEKIILNNQEIPERIFRFGQWYIAEQEIKK